MNTYELVELIEKDEVVKLNDWLSGGGDPNLMVDRKSILQIAFDSGADKCARYLLLYGAQNGQTKNPVFLKMIDEILSSKKILRDLPLTICSIIDDLTIKTLGFEILNEPRSIKSREDGDLKQLFIGLHYFEEANSNFLDETLKNAFDCENGEGEYACVLSKLSKYSMPDYEQYQERLTGFLVLRQIPASDVGNLTMNIKWKEDEYIIGIHYSDQPVLIFDEEYKQFDVSEKFLKSAEKVIAESSKTESRKMKKKISEITNWSHEINSWSQKFMQKHGVYPQILLASSDTFTRIDMVANTNAAEKIKNDKGNSPKEFVQMTGFTGPGYELSFCVDDRLGMDEVVLIFPEDD